MLFIASFFVWGCLFTLLNGHGPNDHDVNQAVERLYIVF